MKTPYLIGIGIGVGTGFAALGQLVVKPYLAQKRAEEEEKSRQEKAQNLIKVKLIEDGTLYYKDYDCLLVRVELRWGLTGKPVQAQTIQISRNGSLFIGTNECGPLPGWNINSTDINGQTAFWLQGAPKQVIVQVLGKNYTITMPEAVLEPLEGYQS